MRTVGGSAIAAAESLVAEPLLNARDVARLLSVPVKRVASANNLAPLIIGGLVIRFYLT